MIIFFFKAVLVLAMLFIFKMLESYYHSNDVYVLVLLFQILVIKGIYQKASIVSKIYLMLR